MRTIDHAPTLTINQSEFAKLALESFKKGVIFAAQTTGIRMFAHSPDGGLRAVSDNFSLSDAVSISAEIPSCVQGGGWIGTAKMSKKALKFAYAQLVYKMDPANGGRF